MPGRRSLPSFAALLVAGFALTALTPAQASPAPATVRSLPARAWTPHTSASATASPARPGDSSSCPEATSDQASASTPGAPTRVHAIGGDESGDGDLVPAGHRPGNVNVVHGHLVGRHPDHRARYPTTT